MSVPEIIISENTIFEGRVMDLKLRQIKLADGQEARREIVVNKGAVVIVPMTASNEVRLLRQYRSAAEKWIFELPAGTLEPGENPDEAAPRELIEETGDTAAHWQKLHGFYSAPGLFTEFLHCYLATDLTPGPTHQESDEHIEVTTVPWIEIIAMVKNHHIEDAKSIAALMLAGLHLDLLKG